MVNKDWRAYLFTILIQAVILRSERGHVRAGMQRTWRKMHLQYSVSFQWQSLNPSLVKTGNHRPIVPMKLTGHI